MNNEINSNSSGKGRKSFNPMNMAMMACCVIMLLPVGFYFLSGGGVSGLGGNLAAFAPLLLCVGAHFLMHKFMGKSCHSDENESNADSRREVVDDAPSKVPQVRRG